MDSAPKEPRVPIISLEDISLTLPSGTFSDDDLFSIYGGSPALDVTKSRSHSTDPKPETHSTEIDNASPTDCWKQPLPADSNSGSIAVNKTTDTSPELHPTESNNTSVEINRTDSRKPKLFEHLQDEFWSNRFKDPLPADKERKMAESIQDGYWSEAASSVDNSNTKTISPNSVLQSKPFIPSLSSKSGTLSPDVPRKNTQDKRNYRCCFPGLSPIPMPWLDLTRERKQAPATSEG